MEKEKLQLLGYIERWEIDFLKENFKDDIKKLKILNKNELILLVIKLKQDIKDIYDEQAGSSL